MTSFPFFFPFHFCFFSPSFQALLILSLILSLSLTNPKMGPSRLYFVGEPVSVLPPRCSPLKQRCWCLWGWFIINSLRTRKRKQKVPSSPELWASFDTWAFVKRFIYQHHRESWIFMWAWAASNGAGLMKTEDQVKRRKRPSKSQTDRLNLFSWVKREASGEAGASRNWSTITPPPSPLTNTRSTSPRAGLLLPKPSASKVWILDARLSYLALGSGCECCQDRPLVYSQNETELHVLLREGWRGCLQPNYHLEGFDCYGHSMPRGCHYQRCHRRCFLGICLSFLFYLSFKVFYLSLLSVFMKAHPLSLSMCGGKQQRQ